ncbi:MAG: photosystem II cytochrome PsbV2 [Gloeomargaritaceae cyanobacterium C42_A2020_066]|nr:photosystem II cytochrome PsbV2 [Gloeomargaritaceae cyanobacterium C42_A2020_066]
MPSLSTAPYREGGCPRALLLLLTFLLTLLAWVSPAQAATGDTYVRRYLRAGDGVTLPADAAGRPQTFTAADLSAGKKLFEETCLNCHVGGATLPNPLVSLSLTDLQGATPPRDNIAALAAFIRNPQTYDGLEPSATCRQLSARWTTDGEVEQLAAFVLRAAQVAPGWGTKKF